MDSPMTGFFESVLTSATGLYTQLIPTIFSSLADAYDTSSASSTDPLAASAIAPGLNQVVNKIFHSFCIKKTYKTVPAAGELNAETRLAKNRIGTAALIYKGSFAPFS